MPDILKVDHLTKNFGQLRAVDDLSFEVRKGEILDMMGPNGAGKTTVFNLLTGVFKPDEGNILFKAMASEREGLRYFRIDRFISDKDFQELLKMRGDPLKKGGTDEKN